MPRPDETATDAPAARHGAVLVARGRAQLSTSPAEAETAARQALRDSPADTAARLLLGAALRRLGRAQEACEALLPLAQVEPQAWGVRFEAGAALLQAGDAEAAAPHLAEAVRRNPRALLAAFVLAEAQGRPRAALLGLSPVQEALVAVCAGSADLEPRLADLGLGRADQFALQLLLEGAVVAGREAGALRALAADLEAAPPCAPLARAWAGCLLADQRPREALEVLERGPDDLARPEDAAALALRAAAHVQLGRHEAADGIYRRLLALQPQAPGLWLAWGHLRKSLGEAGEAAAAYRRALSLSPGLAEAYWSLANLKLEHLTPEERSAIAARLAAGVDGPEAEAALRFALAKALEDEGALAQAFGEYRSANAAAARARPHDPEAHTAFVARSRAAFSERLFAARGGAGCRSDAPIFIIGLPRSGTTLVEQILASHPAVEGLGELPDLMLLARELAGTEAGDYPGLLAAIPEARLRELGETYLARAAAYRRTDRPRFTDKAPGNALHLGLIALALPNARVVEVRREPLAWGVSAFRQHFAKGQHYSYDLAWLGRYYRDHEAWMAHVDRVRPGWAHHLAYERLVEEPEGEVRRLLAHCGLEFDPACLRFHETARAVRTPSAEQVRRPIGREGLDLWRRYEAWLEPLERALGAGGRETIGGAPRPDAPRPGMPFLDGGIDLCRFRRSAAPPKH